MLDATNDAALQLSLTKLAYSLPEKARKGFVQDVLKLGYTEAELLQFEQIEHKRIPGVIYLPAKQSDRFKAFHGMGIEELKVAVNNKRAPKPADAVTPPTPPPVQVAKIEPEKPKEEPWKTKKYTSKDIITVGSTTWKVIAVNVSASRDEPTTTPLVSPRVSIEIEVTNNHDTEPLSFTPYESLSRQGLKPSLVPMGVPRATSVLLSQCITDIDGTAVSDPKPMLPARKRLGLKLDFDDVPEGSYELRLGLSLFGRDDQLTFLMDVKPQPAVVAVKTPEMKKNPFEGGGKFPTDTEEKKPKTETPKKKPPEVKRITGTIAPEKKLGNPPFPVATEVKWLDAYDLAPNEAAKNKMIQDGGIIMITKELKVEIEGVPKDIIFCRPIEGEHKGRLLIVRSIYLVKP